LNRRLVKGSKRAEAASVQIKRHIQERPCWSRRPDCWLVKSPVQGLEGWNEGSGPERRKTAAAGTLWRTMARLLWAPALQQRATRVDWSRPPKPRHKAGAPTGPGINSVDACNKGWLAAGEFFCDSATIRRWEEITNAPRHATSALYCARVHSILIVLWPQFIGTSMLHHSGSICVLHLFCAGPHPPDRCKP